MSPALSARLSAARVLIMRAQIALATGFLVACAPVTRTGLEPLVTDRPDFTESTETVPKGMRQLESGTTFSNTMAEPSASFGEGLLRIGLDNSTELRLAFNSYALTRSSGVTAGGFEDISIGTKLKLMQGGGEGSLKPTVAVILASSFPTGARRMTDGAPHPEVKVGLAWDLTSRVSFSSNLNYSHIGDETSDYHEYAATGSLGVGLTNRLASYAEYFTFQPVGVPVSSSHYLNGGLTYGFTDNLQFDVRSGIGLRRNTGPDYFLGFGISRRW